MTGSPLVIKGWSLYAHPVFLDQLDDLIGEVEARKARDPDTYKAKNCSKRLAAILKVATEVIPADPEHARFRQGDTLGPEYRHWFRAKFFQQYRLFFRFDSASKVIVLGWVNDTGTLRAYGSRTDAYATFRKMLEGGNPPDDFDALHRAAKAASERFRAGMRASESE